MWSNPPKTRPSSFWFIDVASALSTLRSIATEDGCADSFEPQARRYNFRLAGTLAPPKKLFWFRFFGVAAAFRLQLERDLKVAAFCHGAANPAHHSPKTGERFFA